MIEHKSDISNKADVKIFVDAFYDKVRKDSTIGPVFAAVIQGDSWGLHLERMYSFWHSVLFGQPDYRGNPFSKHRNLPIEARHFNRWIDLFTSTIDEHFSGDRADDAKRRAVTMGKMFESKLAYLRQNTGYNNIM